MREGLALTAIGSAALLTLAVAGATTLRHANDLSSKERQALDNSINRIVVEQVARRDEVLPSATAGTAAPSQRTESTQTTGAASRDITQLPPGPEARKEAARRRDPEERAEREARAASARPAKKRQPQGMALRPDRVLPQTFLSIRKLAFDVLR